jgi:hypothetical protein
MGVEVNIKIKEGKSHARRQQRFIARCPAPKRPLAIAAVCLRGLRIDSDGVWVVHISKKKPQSDLETLEVIGLTIAPQPPAATRSWRPSGTLARR